ncbi:MAG: biopolymer transporter ExbD [Planctomycetes bacterium]|nr:biopolymer transporter ExbD [Planctomycetota bacterium]
MAKGRPDPGALAEGGEFELTSMIDVTFLLLIFFMCVTEMTDASKSKIKLPRVENGEEDKNPVPGRLLLNILAEDPKAQPPSKDGQIQILRKDVTDKEANELIKEQVKLGGMDKNGMANKPVLIRADKRTSYRNVRKVMKMCVEHKMVKISFTALAPKKDDTPSPHD